MCKESSSFSCVSRIRRCGSSWLSFLRIRYQRELQFLLCSPILRFWNLRSSYQPPNDICIFVFLSANILVYKYIMPSFCTLSISRINISEKLFCWIYTKNDLCKPFVHQYWTKGNKKIALSDDFFFYDKNLILMFVIFRICFLDFLFVYIISG